MREIQILSRDCPAIRIPSGERTFLSSGTEAMVVQTLGGTFTVETWEGLFRIDGADADALNITITPAATPEVASPSEGSLSDQVWAALRTCYDPEIPINIVDLGLIYRCDVIPLSDHSYRADIDLTLTAPGCGMGEILKEDAERRVLAVPGIKEVQINIVLDPPWDQSRMSEVARLELGFF